MANTSLFHTSNYDVDRLLMMKFANHNSNDTSFNNTVADSIKTGDRSSTSGTTTSLLDVLRGQGPSIIGALDPFQPFPSSRQQQRDREGEKTSKSSNDKRRNTCRSKPIRIQHRQRHAVSTSHREDEVAEEEKGDGEDDLFSTSVTELERFYDQATWRMYMLIQSTRQAAAAKKEQQRLLKQRQQPHIRRVPHAQYHYYHTTSTTTSAATHDAAQHPYNYYHPNQRAGHCEDKTTLAYRKEEDYNSYYNNCSKYSKPEEEEKEEIFDFEL